MSLRAAIGILIAGLVGIGLLHLVLSERFDARNAERAERAAMISARGAAAIAQANGIGGDALRTAIAAWQKEHPAVRAVRVIDVENRTIEASTFASDLAEGELPRRLMRPEKELFDLGQELRGNVEANLAESSTREEEISVTKSRGVLLIAVPLERDGSVAGFSQVSTAPEVIQLDPPPPGLALVVALAPFLLLLAAAFALRRNRDSARVNRILTIAGAVLLLLAIAGYRQWALRSLEENARLGETRVAERVAREAAIVARVTPGAESTAQTWDANVHRVPLRIDPVKAVAGEKEAVRQASWGIGALALALLFFIGFGWSAKAWKGFRRNRQAYYYVAPALIGMLVLVFFPFIYGVALSFTNQTIYSVSKPITELWVGFQNYADILGDFQPIRHTAEGRAANYENFYWTLGFTIAWTIVNVTIGVSVGLALALMLNTKGLRFKGAYRVLLILPWAVPNYITALIWRGMFHQQFGVINQVVQIFGGEPIAWFQNPFTSFVALVATNGWLSFPFMMVVSLGALQSISADLYEAARVDGASRWQQFRAITLPSLKPALIPAVILSVVWTFNMFNIPYLVSGGEPAHSTEILITQGYKLAFEQYRYGYAAAYSTIIFVILLVYGVFQNRMTRATESISA